MYPSGQLSFTYSRGHVPNQKCAHLANPSKAKGTDNVQYFINHEFIIEKLHKKIWKNISQKP